MVEEVIGFSAELELVMFCDGEVLQDGEIRGEGGGWAPTARAMPYCPAADSWPIDLHRTPGDVVGTLPQLAADSRTTVTPPKSGLRQVRVPDLLSRRSWSKPRFSCTTSPVRRPSFGSGYFRIGHHTDRIGKAKLVGDDQSSSMAVCCRCIACNLPRHQQFTRRSI
jgi:hypothetical protein